MTVAPGWYLDPDDPKQSRLRYWDGTAWTEHRATVGQSSEAAAVTASREPAPTEEVTAASVDRGDKRLGYIALAVLAILGIVIFKACVGSGGRDDSGSSPGTDLVSVTYEVTGRGGVEYASFTLETPTGTDQGDYDVPLTTKATGQQGLTMQFPRGSFVYVSAQNPNSWGSLTCRIYVDDVLIAKSTTSTAYGIATCDGKAE